jgi:hypothetical protein
MAHTPGPWFTTSFGYIFAASNPRIGSADIRNPNALDDANLMGMAPEILAALEESISKGLIYWEPNTTRGYESKAEMIARFERLIAKAKAALT